MALRHGRQLATVLIGLALAAAIAACGQSRPAEPPTTAATSAARGAGLSECERKGLIGPGIVTPRDVEGTCRGGGGQMVTLAGFGRIVHLRDLSFKVNGARTVKRLVDGPVDETAHGVFVIVSITLSNESRVVQRVTKNQFELLMNNRRHYFDRDATVLTDPESLWQLTRGGLRPGAAITGDVIFDVPRSLGDQLVARGFVAGVSFATVAAGHPVLREPAGLTLLS